MNNKKLLFASIGAMSGITVVLLLFYVLSLFLEANDLLLLRPVAEQERNFNLFLVALVCGGLGGMLAGTGLAGKLSKPRSR